MKRNVMLSDRVNKVGGSSSELGDLNETLLSVSRRDFSDLSFHYCFGSSLLISLCLLDKFLLEDLSFVLSLFDLFVSFFGIGLSFFSFLLGLLDHSSSGARAVLLLVSRSDGLHLDSLGLLGLLSSVSACFADGTVVLDGSLGESFLGLVDKFLSLDDLVVDRSQRISEPLLSGTLMGE
jgi:hypothetical protein